MRTPRHIHERFLHFIWKNQYLDLTELKSLDGRRLEILDLGLPNRDAGPDFRDAKVRIGTTTYSGDVEIHQDLRDWQKHYHSDDPKYNRVILHVVLRWHPRRALLAPPKTRSGRQIPTLVLEPFLTEPLRFVWQQAILDERRERIQTIPCYERNDDVDSSIIRSWLGKLAVERIELKIRKFEERLKEIVDEHRLIVKEPYPRYYDDPSELPPPVKEYTQKDFSRKIFWEQLLYEGIMEGLGYSKNQEPFLRLARNLTLEFIRQEQGDGESAILNIQAMLFGAAGLLTPRKRVENPVARNYLASLRKAWTGFRKRYRRELCHEADWQFFRLRPQNFPTVRLAAMSFLLEKFTGEGLLRKIMQILKSDTAPEKEKLEKIRSLFSTEAAGFWTQHYTFEGKPHRPTKKLLGHERIDDLILNTVVPVVLFYARIFKDSSVRSAALSLYQQFPPSAPNSVLVTMQSQLLKTRLPFTSAYFQQGAIQLYKFYCVESRCTDCEVGKIVFIDKRGRAAT